MNYVKPKFLMSRASQKFGVSGLNWSTSMCSGTWWTYANGCDHQY